MVVAFSDIGITVLNPVGDIYTIVFLCLIVCWDRLYDVLILHQGILLTCLNNGLKESLQQRWNNWNCPVVPRERRKATSRFADFLRYLINSWVPCEVCKRKFMIIVYTPSGANFPLFLTHLIHFEVNVLHWPIFALSISYCNDGD
jgi:hypothetical protein